MRQARLKVPEDRPVGYYHCLSRVVDGQFIFGDVEREKFVAYLREYEVFCQVKVLTFCVMSNHFHLLVEVPKAPEKLPPMEEVLARLERLSVVQDVGAVRQRLMSCRQRGDEEEERRLLDRYWARMWNVSTFMKGVKQRFSQWYNTRTGRRGTLWESRFKSVLVEGAGRALTAMAAYMDLNPVRAGIVGDPKDYRWSGYGAAMGGDKAAQEGLERVVAALQRRASGKGIAWKEVASAYRMHLYQEGGEEGEAIGEDGRTLRGALKREDVLRVLEEEKGRLGMGDYLKCRVRYFCDGAVFGSREYVEGIFEANRRRFGAKRSSGARRMRGLEEAMYVLRDLRVNVFR
jgi:putative transposase